MCAANQVEGSAGDETEQTEKAKKQLACREEARALLASPEPSKTWALQLYDALMHLFFLYRGGDSEAFQLVALIPTECQASFREAVAERNWALLWRFLWVFDVLEAPPSIQKELLEFFERDARISAPTETWGPPVSLSDAAVDWLFDWLRPRTLRTRKQVMWLEELVKARPELRDRVAAYRAEQDKRRLETATRRLLVALAKQTPLLAVGTIVAVVMTAIAEALVGDLSALVPAFGFLPVPTAYNRALAEAAPTKLLYRLPASTATLLAGAVASIHAAAIAGGALVVGVLTWLQLVAIVAGAVVIALVLRISMQQLKRIRLASGWWLPNPNDPTFPA